MLKTLIRIPLGGARATDFLQQTMQLKYPFQKGVFTTIRAEVMLFLLHAISLQPTLILGDFPATEGAALLCGTELS